MKKIVVTILAVICIAAVCGGFYYVTQKDKNSEEVILTEGQKVNTKNIDTDYPETPREVVKLFNWL